MNIKAPKIKKPEVKIKKPEIKKENMKRPAIGRPDFRVLVTLVKKELFNFFSTPLAYIILVLFVGVVSILFFAVGKFLQVGTTDLSNFFAYISFSFVIVVPAITMSSISREKQNGTIEYLLTQPITEIQLLVSKFLAYSIFILIILLTTVPLVVMIGINGPLDVGQVILQYIGAWVLGMCLVALGIAVSAALRSEIASFLTTVVIAALLILIGSDLIQLQFGLNSIIEKIGLLSHYQSISRGVLDIRDVLYFIAFILAFLSIAFYLLVKDKYPSKNINLRYSQAALVVLIILTLLIGYIGQVIPGRIDFTSNKVYTLSDASVNVINMATDVVNMKLYASDNLPIEFQSQIRNVQDLLRDYQTYSGGKINYQFVSINNATDSTNEAAKAGLQPIQFQVNNSDSTQTIVGYFGITMSYLDKSDVLNLNDQNIVNILEYNVTKKLNKLDNTNLKKVGFVNSSVAYGSGSQSTQTLNKELNELFNVTDVDLTKDIPSDVGAVILAGPNSTIPDDQLNKLKTFFVNGGSVFFLTDPVTVDTQSFTASDNSNSARSMFSDFGITVNQDLVYDINNNNLVNAGYLFPIKYPLWVTAQSTGENISILKDVKEVSYLWGSTISIDNSKTNGESVYKLLETSNASNVQKPGSYSLDPSQAWAPKSGDESKVLAVAIQNAKGGKAVVVGDAKLLSDDYNLVTLNENLAFALGSVEWLTGSDSIASIQAKVRAAPKVNLTSQEATTLTIVGVGLPIAAIIILGILRFYFRRKKQEKKYE